MMKKLLLIAIVLFSWIGIKAQTSLTEAVDFSVKDVEGNVHSLFDILDNQGQYVLIDFFAVG